MRAHVRSVPNTRWRIDDGEEETEKSGALEGVLKGRFLAPMGLGGMCWRRECGLGMLASLRGEHPCDGLLLHDSFFCFWSSIYVSRWGSFFYFIYLTMCS